MKSVEADAAEIMRNRLQTDLRAALVARETFEVAVLRILIAAIDNAGAVPLAPKSGQRQSEVERRRLSVEDVQAILWREHRVREEAADEYARLGRTIESERARREMAIVRRYIAAASM